MTGEPVTMLLGYVGIVAALFGYFALKKSSQLNLQRKRIAWVAQWLRFLRDLLELLPKHRGMSNAFLKGDSSFRAAMEKLQKETDVKIHAMRKHLESRDDGAGHDVLSPIARQWQTIKDNVYSMNADRCFTAHSRLIGLLIERLEDDSLELLVFANSIHRRGQAHISSIIAMLTRELPQVVETIGQARGIGTGVAAQHSSTVANRVKLKYLHSNALSIIDNKLAPLRSMLKTQNDSTLNSMESSINRAISTSQQFLAMLQCELIENIRPNVAPDSVYKQGTAAIDAEFQLFDQLFPRCLQALGLK